MKNVTIYTDGACSGNPGPGGWGAILLYKGAKLEISGGCEVTTNNRMELTAVISALERMNERCKIDIYSDSTYVVHAFECGWIDRWRENGYRKKSHPIKNQDLWMRLDELVNSHDVKFHWVEGHNGDELNSRCDELAVRESRRFYGR